MLTDRWDICALEVYHTYRYNRWLKYNHTARYQLKCWFPNYTIRCYHPVPIRNHNPHVSLFGSNHTKDYGFHVSPPKSNHTARFCSAFIMLVFQPYCKVLLFYNHPEPQPSYRSLWILFPYLFVTMILTLVPLDSATPKCTISQCWFLNHAIRSY